MTEQIVGGKYHLGERIAARSTVQSFKATDDAGQAAVVELMPAAGEGFARLEEWAGMLASLDDSHLPRVLDFGQQGDAFFLAREYVPGTDVSKLLAGGPLDLEKAVTYAAQALAGLEVAHGLDILHGNLRPEDLIVTPSGTVKVASFRMPGQTGHAAALTDTSGEAWLYATPEQAAGHPVTPESDIYSMGAILYAMVTGNAPVAGDAADAARHQILNSSPLPPRSRDARVPPALEDVILRAMSKEPAARYPSAAAMREDLESVLANMAQATKPIPVVGPATAAPAIARPKRRVWPWVLIAAAALLLIGLLAGLVFYQGSQVEVPDLTGQTVTQSRDALTAQGLRLGEISRVPGGTNTVGSVTSQNPPAGTRIPKHSTVGIVLSVLESVPVPDLKGQIQSGAIAVIENSGLKLGSITSQNDPTAPAGVVVDQSPSAGTQVPPGSSVTLAVSLGPKLTTLASVVGESQSTARAALEGAGFTVTIVRQFSASAPRGLVISQSPGAGTNLPSGTSVTLVVSRGPSSVSVPDLVGLSQDDAITSISNVGLTARTSFETSSTAAGLVISQDPAEGTSVSPGSIVEITVGR
jgi:eukaryotic-like serine/threonine-protein kinase